MQIVNCTLNDIDEIFSFYSNASALQKSLNKVVWPVFSRDMVEKELAENRQFKLLINGKIACIWAITFDDPEIWGEKNNDPSVYIHRIATHPDFRGKDLVKEIVEWAIAFAKANQKHFIRLDTIGGNEKLINHYQKCGFNYLGLTKMETFENLPEHYHNATVSLFEIPIKN